MTKTDDSDDEDLLRSQPAFGQLPSQVASGRGTDGSSILAHPVSQRRPSPPTIVTNLLSGLFGQAALDDARRFDNSTASHAMDLSLLASDLQTLKSDQIRKLALNFGCKGVQSATLFNCRKVMATRISMGVIYNNMNMANPSTTTDTIKINTCIRISNALVHPEILPYTLTMNDKKDRADFEHGNGARNENLYTMIADMANDTEHNDEIGVLFHGDGEEGDDDFDIHINKLFKEGNINPRHFTTVSWESVRGFVSDLVKARKNVKNVSRKDEITQFSEWFLIVSFTP
jgi:hypothetical protein